MRSRNHLLFSLGVASALAFGGLGCRNDVHVKNRAIQQAPRAGTLVDTPGNAGPSSPFEGNATKVPTAAPTTAPSAIGGGPAATNPPTGANDEGNPNMSEEPLPVKPDAEEQSAGTTQPPAIAP